MAYRLNPVDEDYVQAKVNKDKQNTTTKLLKIFNKNPTNYSNVKLEEFKPWITEEINKQLPDDDIVIDYIYELLQDYGNEPGREFPDILNLNLQLANFLGEKESKVFCKQLWSLILEASNEPDGIPAVFKEKKEKPTIVQKNEESESTQKTRTKKTNYNRSSSLVSNLDRKPRTAVNREYEHRYTTTTTTTPDSQHRYRSRTDRDRDESIYRRRH